MVFLLLVPLRGSHGAGSRASDRTRIRDAEKAQRRRQDYDVPAAPE